MNDKIVSITNHPNIVNLIHNACDFDKKYIDNNTFVYTTHNEFPQIRDYITNNCITNNYLLQPKDRTIELIDTILRLPNIQKTVSISKDDMIINIDNNNYTTSNAIYYFKFSPKDFYTFNYNLEFITRTTFKINNLLNNKTSHKQFDTYITTNDNKFILMHFYKKKINDDDHIENEIDIDVKNYNLIKQETIPEEYDYAINITDFTTSFNMSKNIKNNNIIEFEFGDNGLYINDNSIKTLIGKINVFKNNFNEKTVVNINKNDIVYLLKIGSKIDKCIMYYIENKKIIFNITFKNMQSNLIVAVNIIT